MGGRRAPRQKLRAEGASSASAEAGRGAKEGIVTAAIAYADAHRFLIVEHDHRVVTAVCSVVTAAGSQACEATTLHEARAAMSCERFIAIVIGEQLPDGEGLHLVRELRERRVNIPALLLGASGDARVTNDAHLLRASCVIKPDIGANVRAFLERAIVTSGDISQRTLAAVRGVALAYRLTGRERELLELIALGVSRECLAIELGISENTLKTLIRKVLQKCNETRVEALARAVLDEVVSLSCTTESL
jgi:DNA-binding NarL/FixJ family response regulator